MIDALHDGQANRITMLDENALGLAGSYACTELCDLCVETTTFVVPDVAAGPTTVVLVNQWGSTEGLPFTVLGAPALKGKFDFSFIPRSLPGKSESPLHMNETCYGVNFRDSDLQTIRKTGKRRAPDLIE